LRDALDRRVHDRERLFFSVLPLAQPSHCRIVACIDDKLKTSQALDRNYRTATNRLAGGKHRVLPESD
jgi:hypothetical protein